MSEDDCAVFFDDPELPPTSLEERKVAIAAELRKGRPSVRFCRLLASAIDGKQNITTFKLKLSRKGRGRPAKLKFERGRSAIAAIDGKKSRGEKKKAKQDVMAAAGVGERTIRADMKAQREDVKAIQWRLEVERQGLQWPDGKEFDE